MKKLKIITYADMYDDKVYLNSAYISFLAQFGEVIMVSTENDLAYWVKEGDVLCIPGGADVDSSRYNEKPHRKNSRINNQFEWLDAVLLSSWIETQKPIIGICRGMQSLNVTLGGSLHQHVINHMIGGSREDTSRQTLFTDIQIHGHDFRRHGINSIHHQAVKQVAEGFEVLGWTHVSKDCPSLYQKYTGYPKAKHVWEKSKNSTIITKSTTDYYYFPEVIKHKTLPYVAFQYHPEEFNCKLARYLINQVLGTDVSLEETENVQSNKLITTLT